MKTIKIYNPLFLKSVNNNNKTDNITHFLIEIFFGFLKTSYIIIELKIRIIEKGTSLNNPAAHNGNIGQRAIITVNIFKNFLFAPYISNLSSK